MITTTCEPCTGTGRIPNPDAGQRRDCYVCAGNGVTKANGGAYKSNTLACAGVAKGTARQCWHCDGEGLSRPAPDTEECRACHGAGQVVVEAHTGDVLPEAIGITDSIPRPVLATLAAELELQVVTQNRHSTWNEAHLGLGAIWGTTDYGRTWEILVQAARQERDGMVGRLRQEIDSFREEVRTKLADDYVQWIKLTDGESRVITDRVAIVVHGGGYTVLSQPSLDSGAMLPPTYTAELLNREL